MPTTINLHSFFIFSSTLILIFSTPTTSSSFLQLPSLNNNNKTISVTDYGATGDGVHYDTVPIQAEIDACSSSGGERVVVAEDAVDVGITGGGEFNGQGLGFVVRFDERKNVMVSWNQTGLCEGDECRPRLVGFNRSKNVRVWDIHLSEPAYWWL